MVIMSAGKVNKSLQEYNVDQAKFDRDQKRDKVLGITLLVIAIIAIIVFFECVGMMIGDMVIAIKANTLVNRIYFIQDWD